LLLTPTNNTPFDAINIDELISKFKNDPKEYKEYLKKIFYSFDRSKQCDSSMNIISHFIMFSKN
jgi:hypothetical protein